MHFLRIAERANQGLTGDHEPTKIFLNPLNYLPAFSTPIGTPRAAQSQRKGILMATEKQLAANRENSKSSSGPTTPEGKAISSHNAVKTGLTGQTVLLRTDDVEAYKALIQRTNDQFEPAKDNERALVQDLADTEWRLLRIVPLESSILAIGRMKLASQFDSIPDLALRASLLEGEVQLTYAKDLRNISLQHTRLRRHRANVLQELTDLQQTRKEACQHQSSRAAQAFFAAVKRPDWPTFNLEDFGFDFTFEDMLESAANIRSLQEGHAFPELSKSFCMEEARQAFYEKWGDPNDETEEE